MSAAPAPAPAREPSLPAQLAIELQRNRELAIRVYALRNECPPDDAASQYSTRPEPAPDSRMLSWEVYASLPGVDTLYTGVAKRTPSGGYFTS